MNKSTISYRLKELRNSKNLTVRELAEELHVSKSTISGWENRTRKPNYIMITKISQFFGVTTDYLLGIENENYNFAHSDKLIELYFNGINHWISDQSLSVEQAKILHEHFADLLGKYKQLIEHCVSSDINWESNKDEYMSKYNDVYQETREIKRIYYNDCLADDIELICNWINALPYKLAIEGENNQ